MDTETEQYYDLRICNCTKCHRLRLTPCEALMLKFAVDPFNDHPSTALDPCEMRDIGKWITCAIKPAWAMGFMFSRLLTK